MELSYRHYCSDATFQHNYIAYQGRYKQTLRESDRVLIEHVGRVLPRAPEQRRAARLLDVGCSTGNLLLHLRQAFPELSLAGADLTAEAVEQCRAVPELAGIPFAVMDMLQLGAEAAYDVILASAVTYLFTPDEYAQAMRSICRALKPGGHYCGYEWFHPYRQELQIVEWSRSHPEGLKMHMRSFDTVRSVLSAAGFDDVQLRPFTIPVDLAGASSGKDTEDGFEDLNTRTVRTEGGERIMFRGALAQPWCHLVARRKAS